MTEITEAYRTAGAWIERHLNFNRHRVARLAGWLTVSGLLLAAEIILWIISLVD